MDDREHIRKLPEEAPPSEQEDSLRAPSPEQVAWRRQLREDAAHLEAENG